MSRLFESFEFLDRRWESRVRESMSRRSIFSWLLLSVLLLGVEAALTAYDLFHLHRVSWPIVMNMAVFGLIAIRYARIIYRSLSQTEKSSSSKTTT
jgi:hypothetical protein